MDLQKLAGTLLSSDSVKGLSDLTGTSKSDVTSVLTQALPALLNGATEQAKGKDTADSFASALSNHAKNDTSNLTDFFGKVDVKDGAKIITHLLGSDKNSILKNVSKKSGVSQKNTSAILSAIAPMLMSLLGQQTDKDEDKDSGIGSLVGTLLENVDVGDLLTGLVGTDTGSSKKKTTKKKSAKKSDSGNILTNLLSGFFK